jgi:hypothetical protein
VREEKGEKRVRVWASVRTNKRSERVRKIPAKKGAEPPRFDRKFW